MFPILFTYTQLFGTWRGEINYAPLRAAFVSFYFPYFQSELVLVHVLSTSSGEVIVHKYTNHYHNLMMFLLEYCSLHGRVSGWSVKIKFLISFVMFIEKFYVRNVGGTGRVYTSMSFPVHIICLVRVSCCVRWWWHVWCHVIYWWRSQFQVSWWCTCNVFLCKHLDIFSPTFITSILISVFRPWKICRHFRHHSYMAWWYRYYETHTNSLIFNLSD